MSIPAVPRISFGASSAYLRFATPPPPNKQGLPSGSPFLFVAVVWMRARVAGCLEPLEVVEVHLMKRRQAILSVDSRLTQNLLQSFIGIPALCYGTSTIDKRKGPPGAALFFIINCLVQSLTQVPVSQRKYRAWAFLCK